MIDFLFIKERAILDLLSLFLLRSLNVREIL